MPRVAPVASSLLLSLALLCSACTEDVPLSGKVIKASSTEYELELQTKPGVEVDVGGHTATADEQGIARLVVPVERLSYMGSSTDLHVMAQGGNFLLSYFGDGVIELPFSPDDAATVGDATHWVKVSSSANAVSGGTLWSFGESGSALMSKDGTMTLGLQAPANATVTFLGRTATMGDDGRGEITFTIDQTLELVPAEAVMGGFGSAPETPVTMKVTLADGSPKDLPMTTQWVSVSGETLRDRLAALPERPLPGTRNAEPLVIHLDAQGHLSASGRKGPLSTMDIVSFGTAQAPRKLGDCDGYHVVTNGVEGTETFSLPREGIDEEVVAWDSHTGKEIGRKVFPAQEYCPFESTSDQSTLQVRPSEEEILAWLMGL